MNNPSMMNKMNTNMNNPNMNNTNMNNTNMNNTNMNNNRMNNYNFGVSGILVWNFHMLMGIFFVYIGYVILLNKCLPPYISVSIIVLGVLAFFYHAHLWYMSSQKQYKKI
jgi:hypothetical protein